jgi:hypothetical protein
MYALCMRLYYKITSQRQHKYVCIVVVVVVVVVVVDDGGGGNGKVLRTIQPKECQ